MQTKYKTGQAILVPATIRSAQEENGVISYTIDGDFWGTIPEDQIIVNEDAQKAQAMRTFMDGLMGRPTDRY